MSSTMTLPEIAQIAFGTVAAVVALTLFVAWRILRKMKNDIEGAAAIERAALEQLAARERAEQEERAKQRAGEPDYKTLYLEECRKREEVFRMVEIAQGERDRWKDIFWQCSSEHGVAQEYMMRINQHFARLLGRNPDAKMPAIRKAFEEKYGDQAKLQIAERIASGVGSSAERCHYHSSQPVASRAGEIVEHRRCILPAGHAGTHECPRPEPAEVAVVIEPGVSCGVLPGDRETPDQSVATVAKSDTNA